MIKSILAPALAHHLRQPGRGMAFGIKKDRFGYPIRNPDPETQEPKNTTANIRRERAAPKPNSMIGTDIRTQKGKEMYNRHLLEDRRRTVERFNRQNDNLYQKPSVPQVEFSEGMRRTGLIGRKHGETRSFLRTGEVVISTLIEIQDNYVLASTPAIHNGRPDFVKLKLGAFDAPNIDEVSLRHQKEFFSLGISPKEVSHEFIVTPEQTLPLGYKLDISHFFVGQYLDVAGVSINRGFQGVIRRWGYKGMGTFGPGKTHRRPGSISTQGLARVLKGKKLAGIMGNRHVMMRDVQVLQANYGERYLVLQGSVQGINGCFLYLSDCQNKDPIQGPLLHYPTFLGERTQLGKEIYDASAVDPTETFQQAIEGRRKLTLS